MLHYELPKAAEGVLVDAAMAAGVSPEEFAANAVMNFLEDWQNAQDARIALEQSAGEPRYSWTEMKQRFDKWDAEDAVATRH